MQSAFGKSLLVGPVKLDFVPMLAKHYAIQWSGQWNVESVRSPQKPYAVKMIKQLNDRDSESALKLYAQLEPALNAFYRLQAPLFLKDLHPWAGYTWSISNGAWAATAGWCARQCAGTGRGGPWGDQKKTTILSASILYHSWKKHLSLVRLRTIMGCAKIKWFCHKDNDRVVINSRSKMKRIEGSV